MRDREGFLFQGQRYAYFDHRYKLTAFNERAVEVALALAALRWLPTPLLEIGNVLSHYGVQGHTIVDRYEGGEGVLNVDIEAWTPDAPFASVVSISTLEHIGWDDEERDPEKARRVLQRILDELLVPGGHLFLTVPLGHHPPLDQHILQGECRARVVFLQRINAENEWREALAGDLGTPRYGYPFPNGNVVAVLTLW